MTTYIEKDLYSLRLKQVKNYMGYVTIYNTYIFHFLNKLNIIT